jgi:hypothetical protein
MSSLERFKLKTISPTRRTSRGKVLFSVGRSPGKPYVGILKITEGGRREQHVGNAACPACDSPVGQHWPQPHCDGIVIEDCLGLVDCEEVWTPGARCVFRCIPLQFVRRFDLNRDCSSHLQSKE